MRPAYSRHEFTYKKNVSSAGGQPRLVLPGLLSDSDAKLGIFYKLTNFWPEITKFINIALKKKKKKQIFGLFPFILTIANLILKNYLHAVGFEKYF